MRPTFKVDIMKRYFKDPILDDDNHFYRTSSGMLLTHIHTPFICEGRQCPIHHPSDHHMKNWPTHWDIDDGEMLRVCEHGYCHPDPDDVWFQYHRDGYDDHHIPPVSEIDHVCDGCCTAPDPDQLQEIGT